VWAHIKFVDLRLQLLSFIALMLKLGTKPAYAGCVTAVLSLRARHHATVPYNATRFANSVQVLVVHFGFFA
jgi:hypothetical protein